MGASKKPHSSAKIAKEIADCHPEDSTDKNKAEALFVMRALECKFPAGCTIARLRTQVNDNTTNKTDPDDSEWCEIMNGKLA